MRRFRRECHAWTRRAGCRRSNAPNRCCRWDGAVAPINDQGRQDLLEVIDDRVGKSAVIITSQLPVANWHAYLGEAPIADAILDRVVHAAHRLELKGESMRKVRAAVSSTAG